MICIWISNRLILLNIFFYFFFSRDYSNDRQTSECRCYSCCDYMSLLLVLLWFDELNIHLEVNWQMINQNVQNADTFIMCMKNNFNSFKKCYSSRCVNGAGHSVWMTVCLHKCIFTQVLSKLCVCNCTLLLLLLLL